MTNREASIRCVGSSFLQVLIPVIGVTAEATGRFTPDFGISVLTLSDGGSIDDGGQIKIKPPGDHIIRIIVANSGSVTGSS